jgi:hypothetical protein
MCKWGIADENDSLITTWITICNQTTVLVLLVQKGCFCAQRVFAHTILKSTSKLSAAPRGTDMVREIGACAHSPMVAIQLHSWLKITANPCTRGDIGAVALQNPLKYHQISWSVWGRLGAVVSPQPASRGC